MGSNHAHRPRRRGSYLTTGIAHSELLAQTPSASKKKHNVSLSEPNVTLKDYSNKTRTPAGAYPLWGILLVGGLNLDSHRRIKRVLDNVSCKNDLLVFNQCPAFNVAHTENSLVEANHKSHLAAGSGEHGSESRTFE